MNEKALFYDCTTGLVVRCMLVGGGKKKKWWVITPGEKSMSLEDYAHDFYSKEENFRLLAMCGEKTDIKTYVKMLGAAMDFAIADAFTNCMVSSREFRRLGGVVDDKTALTLSPIISSEWKNDGKWDLEIYDGDSGFCVFIIYGISTKEDTIQILNGFKLFAEELENVTFKKTVIVNS